MKSFNLKEDNKVTSVNFRFSARCFRKRNFCSNLFGGWWGGGEAAAPISLLLATALYTSVTDSLSFWPIYHRQSTDTPPTINGQRIGRVSADTSTEISADSRSICWPSLGRYTSVNKATDISRSTYRPSVDRYVNRHIDRYVDRYISRESVDMSTDISVEGCTKYTGSV